MHTIQVHLAVYDNSAHASVQAMYSAVKSAIMYMLFGHEFALCNPVTLTFAAHFRGKWLLRQHDRRPGAGVKSTM